MVLMWTQDSEEGVEVEVTAVVAVGAVEDVVEGHLRLWLAQGRK